MYETEMGDDLSVIMSGTRSREDGDVRRPVRVMVLRPLAVSLDGTYARKPQQLNLHNC